jgi:hypothetical protein
MSTRDAFETWWVSMPADERPDYKVAWLVWKAAALAQPDDWVLVPREPTTDIRYAILEANHEHETEYPLDGVKRSLRIYRAMIAAAPQEQK